MALATQAYLPPRGSYSVLKPSTACLSVSPLQSTDGTDEPEAAGSSRSAQQGDRLESYILGVGVHGLMLGAGATFNKQDPSSDKGTRRYPEKLNSARVYRVFSTLANATFFLLPVSCTWLRVGCMSGVCRLSDANQDGIGCL